MLATSALRPQNLEAIRGTIMSNIFDRGFVPVALPFAGAASGQQQADAFLVDAQQSASGNFLDNVRAARTSGEKRDLIDAFAAGFLAASRGGANFGHINPPSYIPSAPTPGLPALPVGLTGPVAGVPTLVGIEQARREAFAGVAEGFQHFAGLVEESAIPETVKNTLLDGLASLLSQLAGFANSGANGNSGPLPQLPPPVLPASNGAAPGVWTHEKKDDGTAEIRLGDKYTINLKEGDESFTVRNNETGAVTRVWGDPHVDKNNDGNNDFDFKKDLTFQLDDGTKITVDTIPSGKNGQTLASRLTITNGYNAIQVSGLAGAKDGANNLEVVQSNAGITLDALVDDGAQILHERGKDWVDANGQGVNQAVIDAVERNFV